MSWKNRTIVAAVAAWSFAAPVRAQSPVDVGPDAPDAPDAPRARLELGADPTLRESNYNGTPLDWAAHNQQQHVVEYLAKLDRP